MTYTKKQIANFLNDRILFRFTISNEFVITFNEHEELFTFDEIEKIVKSNLDYWKSISDKIPNDFSSNWQTLSNKVATIRQYFTELEEFNLDDVQNYLYYNLSNNRESREQDKLTYILSISSLIDKDAEIRKIKSFVSFYLQQADSSIEEAVKSFIRLSKNPHLVGSYFSNSYHYQFYPALYLLRKNFSNIKENISDFEKNIVDPLTSKLNELSEDSDEQFREITTFTQTKHDEIQQQFDEKVDELTEFQDSIDNWQEEKQNRLKELEETYNVKLSLEAPEKLWNDRSIEHQNQARNWTFVLIGATVLLIIASALLVLAVYDYSKNVIKSIPFISESFILITVISFFIYIIRILIKIVISNHHLATEYKQKAAMTRFYQSLIYSGIDIDKDERLIIINSLFSKIDTGLVKTDNSGDIDTILAILSKNIK
ncbi:DUF6161 domain-containing protein [Streptococcus agalactiae]|uniref:DUF6161 domain-containing protein n=1 Tax=Streptococcus agalactiae TaxID=1311 RepID=UPI00031086ED|nr:DUF6161 domain-containing protein [Streptococcus agalactiae]EPX04599.1 hypothetical protein SAG0163_01555 [Streptococcus agalactiae MRI Z1-215]OCL40053.1 hypothetical protein AX277_04635 [Streptococcus agalactiae]